MLCIDCQSGRTFILIIIIDSYCIILEEKKQNHKRKLPLLMMCKYVFFDKNEGIRKRVGLSTSECSKLNVHAGRMPKPD